ncbi:DUF3298 domain-containing protein [uncultured Devosia sp.]|uniref:DUF3298 domain-containing protein n=1 Tax=uncultured Devosia sp. TaxID=211434 RepID=UPI00260A55FC|nr:DUF3298 domain-containing protein [uncultured Devosia sp.]
MNRFLPVFLLLIWALPQGAHAASFDCAKAATPFERAICDDPELSRADERLAKTYATAIGGLSDAALAELRSSQRAWLDYAQRACTRTAEPLTQGSYDERGLFCLKDVFASRSHVLEMSRMIEGLRVYPHSRYAAAPDPYEADNPDSNWPVAQHELALVQIDSDEAFAESFNALVEAEGQKMASVFAGQGGPEDMSDDSSSDSTNSIGVHEITDNRLSLVVNTYWYGHGAAHGNYTITYLHFLKEEGRWLEAGDIFAGKGWQKTLVQLVSEAAMAEHGDALWPDSLDGLNEVVTDPARWDVSDPYGLVVQFQPYEISAYAYGAPTARVSWEALQPILAETADRYRYGY